MPKPETQNRSFLGRFATPHTFCPDMSSGEALVAVAAVLARIFGGCVLFALWGGATGAAWSAIGNHFWRWPAVAGLFVVFVSALAGLMMATAAIERRISR